MLNNRESCVNFDKSKLIADAHQMVHTLVKILTDSQALRTCLY